MKKTILWIASLALAFNLSIASAKIQSYEEKRTEQYKKFYQTYTDKDYKIINSGTITVYSDNETKQEPLTVLVYGNNLDDNLRYPYIHESECYYQGSDGEWYVKNQGKYMPVKGMENIPQAVRDINTLPKGLKEKVSCMIHYPVDNDSKIMTLKEDKLELYEKLKEIDEARDSKNMQEVLKPVTLTENQKIHFDVFFADMDKDGSLDHIASKYCMDGTMFSPEAVKKRFQIITWHELDKEGKRKHETPDKIMIDFDQDEEYEEKGFDIEFNDDDHDGVFESYKLLKKII